MSYALNSRVNLIAARFAEAAPYLTVASSSRVKDQLSGKKMGGHVKFYIPDTCEPEKGWNLGSNAKRSLNETIIDLQLEDYHIALSKAAVDKPTNIEDFDKECVQPNLQKLAQKIVRDQIAIDFPKANKCFIGEGFLPLAKASAGMLSITGEDVYGFISPLMQNVMTANGQAFHNDKINDTFYHKGLLGTYHNVEYRAINSLPRVVVSASAATDFAAATITSITEGIDYDTVKLTSSNGSSTAVIKAGTPIRIVGAKAADLVGDASDSDFYVIAMEDATAASGVIDVKVPKFRLTDSYKNIVKEDSTEFTNLAEIASECSAAMDLAAGTYATGIVRSALSYEFTTLDTIDGSNTKATSKNIEGVYVHENEAADINDLSSIVRWDIVPCTGVTDDRLQGRIFVKM